MKKYRRGQSLVEYGLILALVSVVAIAVLDNVGGEVKSLFNNVSNSIGNSTTELTINNAFENFQINNSIGGWNNSQGLGQVDIDGQSYGVWIREPNTSLYDDTDTNGNYMDADQMEGMDLDKMLEMMENGELIVTTNPVDANGDWVSGSESAYSDSTTIDNAADLAEYFDNNQVYQP